ncbi:rhomboid family intramembrane serine protease [Massilia sp. TSP1-1-2]|uniref:rhomboid family intramembrane serine protease n=1 Tax=unclassified Massilia TaxID=2609279 RepID=UPI003CEF0894
MNSAQPARYAPPVFLVFLGLNIVLFAIQLLQGIDPMSPDTVGMIRWGANLAPLTLTGEPWRLLSSMFLHFGLIHLALNCYMLLMLGGIVEREFGSARFALIYLLSGLFGSLASALWYTSFKVSAGASGALMGIAGACLAHALIAWLRKEQSEAVRLTGPLTQTIGINLVLGALNPAVDNACHVGGLLAGALIGAVFTVTRFEHSAAKRAAAAAIVSVAALALLYVTVSRPPSPELVQLKLQLQAELDGKPPMAEAP